MSIRCSCIKTDGNCCTRDASTEIGKNHSFCWQHQHCLKSTISQQDPLKLTQTTPQVPSIIKKHVVLKKSTYPESQLQPQLHPQQLLQLQLQLQPTYPAQQQPQPRFVSNIQLIQTQSGKGLWICGETKPHQEYLRSIGSKWNSSKSCWVMPFSKKTSVLDHFGLSEKDIVPQLPEVSSPSSVPMVSLPLSSSSSQSPPSITIIMTDDEKNLLVCGEVTPHTDFLISLGGQLNTDTDNCWIMDISVRSALLTHFKLSPTDIQRQLKTKQPKKIQITESGPKLRVCGETRPHHDFLMSVKGRWNRALQCWIVPLKYKEHLLEHFVLTPDDLKTQEPEGEVPVLMLFFDGASKGNPGPAGYGYHLIAPTLGLEIKNSGSIGNQTNNVAEYQGLINGLHEVHRFLEKNPELSDLSLQINGDSELIIKQVKGEYQVKNFFLQTLHQEVIKLLDELTQKGITISLQHVYRKDNSIADQLASDAAK